MNRLEMCVCVCVCVCVLGVRLNVCVRGEQREVLGDEGSEGSA